jgi:hypothetical protein
VRRWAGWALRIALTLAVTYFLFRSLRVSSSELSAVDLSEWRPDPWRLSASVVLLLAVFVYVGGLWSRMVREFGGPALKIGVAVWILFLGNLGRYVPGKIWQLAGLTYLAGKRGVSLPVASSSAVLGQVFALGAAACIAALGAALGATSRYPEALLPWALALAGLIALTTMFPVVLRFILRIAFKLSRRQHEVPDVAAGFGARWLGLYMPAWLGYGIAFGLLWSSFPALPAVFWPAAVGGFAGAYFVGYAALFAPAGVGVREGALALMLAPWTGATEAAVLAVIARLWMTLAELLPLGALGAAGALRRLSENDPETRKHDA